MFSVYCGLALHHAKLYDKIRRSEQKYKGNLNTLKYVLHTIQFSNLQLSKICFSIFLKLHWKFCPITTHHLQMKWMILSQKEPKTATKKWRGM